MPALNCATDLACQRESSAQQPPSMRAIIIGGEEFRIQGAMIACNSEGEDPGDNTVIGLLKQIAENTTPA
jgi:hypothetical protein